MNKQDYKRETEDLLQLLLGAGFLILTVNNGESVTAWNGNLVDEKGLHQEFIAEAMATDEAVLRVSLNGKKSSLFLVYGNGAGELVCDYTADVPELEAVVDSFYTRNSKE